MELQFADLEVPGAFVIPAAQIQKQIAWSQQNRHAACYFQRVDCVAGPFFGKSLFAVVDLFDERVPSRTVTNDAEYVVHVLLATREKNERGFPIVYRDTTGNWDELLHDSERFRDFYPLRTTDFQLAMERCFKRHFGVEA